MTTINRVGFRYTNFQENEEPEVQELLAPEFNKISTVKEAEPTQQNEMLLTPAHMEVKTRIAMCEQVIMSKGFSKQSEKQRAEFVEELKFLNTVDAQLMMSYL